jgi:hypothetical protein
LTVGWLRKDAEQESYLVTGLTWAGKGDMGPRPGEMDVGDASDEDTGAGDGGDRREHITCIWVYRIYIYNCFSKFYTVDGGPYIFQPCAKCCIMFCLLDFCSRQQIKLSWGFLNVECYIYFDFLYNFFIFIGGSSLDRKFLKKLSHIYKW